MEPADTSELDVLLAQLDELLADGAVDEDDAIEIICLAGLARRLGAPDAAFDELRRWLDDRGGRKLLDEAWRELDVEEYTEGIEAVLDGDATDEDVEDAVLDFDELVAGAVFDGRARVVKKAAAEVENTIRSAPELFGVLAAHAKEIARWPEVAQHLDVYAYWLALADCPEPDDA
jgi:hypothetical protein